MRLAKIASEAVPASILEAPEPILEEFLEDPGPILSRFCRESWVPHLGPHTDGGGQATPA